MTSIVELPSRILERYQVDDEDIERARWLRDRLDEEISGRIARAEST